MYKKLKDFFWILVKVVACVEVIFGILWIIFNIFGFYEDSIAYNYISASKTIIIDDYMGIGYAVLVRLLGHGPVLYLVQFLSLFIALFPFGVTDKAKKLDYIFADILIVFNPPVLQATFAVLPNAFILAVAIGLIRVMFKLNKSAQDVSLKEEVLRCIEVVALELALGLLNKDFAVIMLIISLPIIVFLIVKKRKGALLILALTFLSCFFCRDINVIRTNVYEYGNVEKSLNYLAIQRYAWGHISESSELVEVYYGRDLYYEMFAGDRVPERIGRSFGRNLERIGGKENTEGVYKYITDIAKSKGLGYYGKAIVRDFAYYSFTPFTVLYVYLTGKTETLIANPLFNFTKNAPSVSKAYLIFSEVALLLVTLTGIIGLFMSLITKANKNKTNIIFFDAYVIYIIICVSLYLTYFWVRGFNYIYAVIIVAAWPLLSILSFEGKDE